MVPLDLSGLLSPIIYNLCPPFRKAGVQSSKVRNDITCCHLGAYYPAACTARGYVIGRGVYILAFFWNQSFISKNIHFERSILTDRLLIEFNSLWYSLAARQVFVAIANPDSLSFGKGSPTPETQHCSKPHPYDSRYHTKMVEHAYSTTGTWLASSSCSF